MAGTTQPSLPPPPTPPKREEVSQGVLAFMGITLEGRTAQGDLHLNT